MKKKEVEHCEAMLKEDKPYTTWKRYFWSSLRVFLATFIPALGVTLQTLDLTTLESFTWSTVASLLVVPFNLSIKALMEYYMLKK